MNKENEGLFITALGLPCSGKSTVMEELSKLIASDKIFLEPEELYWPEIKLGLLDSLVFFSHLLNKVQFSTTLKLRTSSPFR